MVPQWPRLLRQAQENGLKTSIDVVTESGNRYKNLVPPSLKYTNYCCINETEAQMITDVPLENLKRDERQFNFRKACTLLKGHGCQRLGSPSILLIIAVDWMKITFFMKSNHYFYRKGL